MNTVLVPEIITLSPPEGTSAAFHEYLIEGNVRSWADGFDSLTAALPTCRADAADMATVVQLVDSQGQLVRTFMPPEEG